MTQNIEKIQILHKQMKVEDIQDWLATKIAEQLGIEAEEINYQEFFDSYGLESVQQVHIANLVNKFFGLQLSPLVIYNYPNIEALSDYIAAELKISEVEVFEF